MSVDLRKVKKLIELVEESGISELEVRDGEETIRIARNIGRRARSEDQMVSEPGEALTTGERPSDSGFELRAPMAGTFYRAPGPEAEPFVSIGQRVEAGDVLCIIESMKMMNEVTAERAGVCVGISVDNGQAIGSGKRLMRFE